MGRPRRHEHPVRRPYTDAQTPTVIPRSVDQLPDARIGVRCCPARFPDWPDRHLVHETIYQAIYRPKLGGLRRDLPRVLRTGRAAAGAGGIPRPAAPAGWSA